MCVERGKTNSPPSRLPSAYSPTVYTVHTFILHVHASFILHIILHCSSPNVHEPDPQTPPLVPDPGVQTVAQKLRIIVLYRLAFQKSLPLLVFLQSPCRCLEGKLTQILKYPSHDWDIGKIGVLDFYSFYARVGTVPAVQYSTISSVPYNTHISS